MMPQIVANEREDMTGASDPTGVVGVLPHTGSGTQLPQGLFADGDLIDFDDGFSGKVSYVEKEAN
jgi:hypothetical protein